MIISTCAVAAIPNNEAMSSFLAEDKSHIEAIEKTLNRRLRVVTQVKTKIPRENSPIAGNLLGSPKEVKDMAKKALGEVRAYVNPSYEIIDPSVFSTMEAWLAGAAAIALPQLALFTALMGGNNFVRNVSFYENLLWSGVSVSIYLKRLWHFTGSITRAPAHYNPILHRITVNEFQIHSLRTLIFHEGTHSIQAQNPNSGLSVMMDRTKTAFIEGQAIDIEHQLGTTVDPNDHGLVYFTQHDAIAAYLMLCRAHNRRPKEALT